MKIISGHKVPLFPRLSSELSVSRILTWLSINLDLVYSPDMSYTSCTASCIKKGLLPPTHTCPYKLPISVKTAENQLEGINKTLPRFPSKSFCTAVHPPKCEKFKRTSQYKKLVVIFISRSVSMKNFLIGLIFHLKTLKNCSQKTSFDLSFRKLKMNFPKML